VSASPVAQCTHPTATVPATTDDWHQRVAVARACRVMARTGLVEDVLGHVSLRLGPDRLLLRCRGPAEQGLRFTQPADVRAVDLDGRITDGGDRLGYAPPTEAPIHLEAMRRDRAVGAVVHAHPPDVVVAGLAGLPLVPLFGSYDIPASALAAAGIPLYPRSVLLRRADLALEMLAVMGDQPVCLLRGHGLVTIGADVEEALLRALAVDRLCRIAWRTAAAGGSVTAIPDADRAELPDLGSALNRDTIWRFHLATLAADGWDLTDDERTPPAEAEAGGGG
jgi:ribulose-5-phosphate 4-epimerase/fuculose-1-phosphate aldolase